MLCQKVLNVKKKKEIQKGLPRFWDYEKSEVDAGENNVLYDRDAGAIREGLSGVFFLAVINVGDVIWCGVGKKRKGVKTFRV